MKNGYNKTVVACFIGYVVQAVVNNFAPLLFLMFHTHFNIPLSKITLLITVNFGLQLLIDLVSAGLIDRIGYRASAVIAHVLAAAGLFFLAILPGCFTDPFIGLLIAVLVYATGGGLLEVLVSPIVEACPTKNKEKAMSLLHSFYCWGVVGVVLFSTLFFALFGIQNWRILACLWALLPVGNALLFAKVPIASLHDENVPGLTIRELVTKRAFWILMLLMLCAGACEQSVSQWASAFAQLGLGVGKTVGDLAGPMLFAIVMGVTRVFYGTYGGSIDLKRGMKISAVFCITAYLIISFSPFPVLGFFGCGLCGASVALLWPGTFSLAAVTVRGGGTALFAFLALAGDLGCMAGPTLVGFVSGAAGDNLKTGIFAALIFPLLLITVLFLHWKPAAR